MTNRKRADAEAADVIRQRCELLELAAEFCRATSKELEPTIDLRPTGYRRAEGDSMIPGVQDKDLGDLHLASMFWNVADTTRAVRTLLDSDPYNQRPIGSLTRGIAEAVGVISWIAQSENREQRQARALRHLIDSMAHSISKAGEAEPGIRQLEPFVERLRELYRATGYKELNPGNSGFVRCIELGYDNRALYSMLSSLSHPDALFSMTRFIKNRQDGESQFARSVELAGIAIVLPGLAIHAVEGLSRSGAVAEMSQTLLMKMAPLLRE